MPLPSVVTPEFKTTLPLSKKEVLFRPFLVKEEKILYMAMEGSDEQEIQNASVKILNNCILNDVEANDLPNVDVEWMFLQLRSKSVGEVLDLNIVHPNDKCTQATSVKVNLEDLKVTFDPEHTNVIEFDNGVGLKLAYPTMRQTILSVNGKSEVDQMFSLIASSVVCVFQGEEVYEDFTIDEMEKFIENLSQPQFEKVMNFFNTLPKLEHDLKFNCAECGEEVEFKISGLSDFFT